MTLYRNLNGDSNVRAYELAQGAISVQFNDGSVYTYTSQSAGAHIISQMQALATRGRGLNSFINRNVRKQYAHRR